MKKLLVVVDYQNDFVNGSLGFEGAELLDEPIAEKVETYRAEGADIVYHDLLHDAPQGQPRGQCSLRDHFRCRACYPSDY